MISPTQRRHDQSGSDEEIVKTAPTTSPAQRRHEFCAVLALVMIGFMLWGGVELVQWVIAQ